jgi:hypothetical protein
MEEVIHVDKYTIAESFGLDEYRTGCMTGATHPLEIEKHCYRLTTIATLTMDAMVRGNDSRRNKWPYIGLHLTGEEQNFIRDSIAGRAMSWAIENSFDGLYIQKDQDLSRLVTIFRVSVYMKEEHITFWRLQFANRR